MIRKAADLRATTDAGRATGAGVALVPTMGALHAGHDSLLRRARRECGLVVMSLFVNPLQFAQGEDLEGYPRDEAADLRAAEGLGVDVVWAPAEHEMYPDGRELLAPDPGPVGDTFEGAARPGHFGGVLKAVHRLFDVCGPCAAYFGEKDAQQLFLVRRMVKHLDLPVEVVPCPTVREADGLACSSRNTFLSAEERDQAGCLFLGLMEAAELSRDGERDAAVLTAAVAREVGATPLARLDYAAVVDEETFTEVRTVERSARALVAARLGSTRLIDNLRLSPGEPVGDADAASASGRGD